MGKSTTIHRAEFGAIPLDGGRGEIELISGIRVSARTKNTVFKLGLKCWRFLFLAGLCSLLNGASSRALAISQDQATPPAPQTEQKSSAPASKASQDSSAAPASKPATKASSPKTTKPAAKKSGTSQTHATAAKRKRRPISPRVRRIREAFSASTTLRPMAQQLILDRTPAAYSGVETYARAHSKEDAGALAWLVVGYAHFLDHDCAKAIEPLNRAKPLSGDLGDYVSYYLGTCYLQTGRQAEGLAALANFATTYPDSLLIRDAALSYGNALLNEGRASEAAEILEKHRTPARSDIELAIGKAYAALKDYPKASIALSNVYYSMPLSPDADAANDELRKLPIGFQATIAQRQTRAELLMKGKHYNDAVDEYRQQAIHATPETRPAAELALADALYRSGRHREAKAELTNLPNANADQAAQRLYILAEAAWAAGENDTFYHTVDDLRQSAPTSPVARTVSVDCRQSAPGSSRIRSGARCFP